MIKAKVQAHAFFNNLFAGYRQRETMVIDILRLVVFFNNAKTQDRAATWFEVEVYLAAS